MSKLHVTKAKVMGGMNALYLRFSGVVDHSVANQVAQQVANSQGTEELNVVFDFGEADAIVGAGMQMILDVFRRIGRKRVVLMCRPGQVHDTLAWAGMTELFATLIAADEPGA